MIASTRYSYGDEYADQHVELIRSRPRRTEAMGGVVRCLPGFKLDVAEPTTIGLGDTFVGGFLAAVSQKGTATWT